MNTEQVLDSLIAAVDVDNRDVDEYTVLASLMVRSGLMWRCISPSCRGLNHLKCQKCDNCGARAPKKHSQPEPESMVGVSFEYERWVQKRARQKAKQELIDNRAKSPEENGSEQLDHQGNL